MNVSESIETVEAKIGLMASQADRAGREAIRRQIETHLDDIRTTLGLPCEDVCCCGGCGAHPLQACIDCGGHYCVACGDVRDGEFVCNVCLEDSETAQENEAVYDDSVAGPDVTRLALHAVDAEVAT